MKLITKFAPVLLALVAACASHSTQTIPDGQWTGDQEVIDEVVLFSVVDANPTDFYDRMIFMEADASAVCKKMGCWMQIEDEGTFGTVRWGSGCGGNYKFPEEAIGERVLIQCMVYPKELTEEQVAELAAEGADATATTDYVFDVSAVMIIED